MIPADFPTNCRDEGYSLRLIPDSRQATDAANRYRDRMATSKTTLTANDEETAGVPVGRKMTAMNIMKIIMADGQTGLPNPDGTQPTTTTANL
jgi:hypothetical protein